jgi:translation initiation factor 2 beta subunit (eIF-2beta)/eIF-5
LNNDLIKSNDILNISFNSPNKTTPNATQKHLPWINNPIIKTISVTLWDNIKSLHSDLHKKDMECMELESKLNSLKSDFLIDHMKIYLKEYVICKSCKSINTYVERDKNLRKYNFICINCNNQYFI